MEKENIFKLIHAIETVTNETVIKWTKSFQYNIGISPVLVLSELKAKGARKQTELANDLGYTPGAMTNIATKLVKLGFAERQYNENDRRHVLLNITPKGIEVLKEAQRKGQELRLELFSVLTEEEIKQYLSIYEKLLNHMKK